MDRGGPIKRGSMMDVTPPGGTPAAPSSKPVFTNHQQLEPDPMMSGKPTPFDVTQPTSTSTSVPITDAAPAPQPFVMSQPQAPAPETQNSASEPMADSTVGSGAQPVPPVQVGSNLNVPSQSTFEPLHKLAHEEPMFGQFKKPKKMKKVLLALLILIVVGGLAAAGYWYMNKSKDSTAKTTATTAPAVSETKESEKTTDKKLYTSKLSNFSMSNKYDWKVTETDTGKTIYADQAKQYNTTFSTVDFAINDKQKLSIQSNPGGRGGDCPPKASDKPFVKGNFCGSYRALLADKLPDQSYPEDKKWDGAYGAYVLRYQVMEPTVDDGVTYTLIGLVHTTKDADGKEEKIELNKDSMGAIWDRTALPLKMEKGYIDVVISDNDGKMTQLSEIDLNRVNEVLLTFKLI